MRDYRVLIIGTFTKEHDLNLNHVRECWQYMTVALYSVLKQLPHVTLFPVHAHHQAMQNFDYYKLPKVDFIIFIGLPETYNALDLQTLKDATEYKHMVTFMERGINRAEHSFIFKQLAPAGAQSFTYIPLPIMKKWLTNEEKEPNTIIVDHCLCWEHPSWTHCIQGWLEEFKDEFNILRLVQLPKLEEKCVPDWVTPINECGYMQYLKATAKASTYIVTNCESYGFGIIDMLARGIRVICPPNYIDRVEFIDKFQIPQFKSKEQLLQILRSPVPPVTNTFIDKCTDYKVIAELIDLHFQEFLLKQELRK